MAPVTAGASPVRATVRLQRPLHLVQTLGPMARGSGDPTMRLSVDRAVRATNTPDGAATIRVCLVEPLTCEVEAWGPGAGRAMDGVADLLGQSDDPEPLRVLVEGSSTRERPLLRDLIRLMPGLRIPRNLCVFETLAPTILEQRVTGAEARSSYRDLVRRFGTTAPGPAEITAGMMTPPTPDTFANLAYWQYHAAGVEMKRARTLTEAARRASQLDGLIQLPPAVARERMMSIPGIGPWTASETALLALGDADAVSVGDYHIPHQIAYGFRGQVRGSDELLLELLEPYRGQRGRVIRLIQAAGIMAPRRGPRLRLNSFRSY